MGIKEIKEVVVFMALLANAIDKTTADGLQLADFGEFMGAIGALPSAIDGIDQIDKEFKDLDAAEKAEILSELKTRLDLRDDVLEGLIEEGLTLGVGLWGLVAKVREARK